MLGPAALRQRDVVHTWAGVLLVLSPLVRMGGLALGLHALPALASVMLTAAFGAVLLRRD